MRVCVTVMCGQLLQNETVMLSIIKLNNTARGRCMNIIIILHAVDEIYCVSFSLYTAGINFITPEQMSITLTASSESDCVMIMTVFDEYQISMDKQFQILMQPSASTESDTVVYMPDTTNITITNRTSTILSLKHGLLCWSLTYFIVPLPTIMPSEKKVSTGGTTGFQVNVNFPAMKFQWLYNNMSIVEEERYSGITTNNLTVMNITKGDAGYYSCNVTTEFGLTVTSQQAQLQVCKY